MNHKLIVSLDESSDEELIDDIIYLARHSALEIEEIKRYNIGVQHKRNQGSIVTKLNTIQASIVETKDNRPSPNIQTVIPQVSLSFKTVEKKILDSIAEESQHQEDEEMGGTVASPRDLQSGGCDFSKKRSRVISSDLSPNLLDSDIAEDELNQLSLGSPQKRQKLILENHLSVSGVSSTLNISIENQLINSAGRNYNLRKKPAGKPLDRDFVYDRVFIIPKKQTTNCKHTTTR